MNIKEMTDRQLLSSLLGRDDKDILPEAKLQNILQAPMAIAECRTDKEARKLRAASEIIRRFLKPASLPKGLEDLDTYLIQRYRYETQEIGIAVILDEDWNILSVPEVFKGLQGDVLIGGKEVFRKALMYPSARYIIIAHNHPSGSPEPSEGDFEMTKKICTEATGIELYVVDSIIIGDGKYVSMYEEKLFDFEKIKRL